MEEGVLSMGSHSGEVREASARMLQVLNAFLTVRALHVAAVRVHKP